MPTSLYSDFEHPNTFVMSNNSKLFLVCMFHDGRPATRRIDGALQVIRHHDFGHAAEELKSSLMRTDPVPQVLPGGGFREGIAAGAQHGHEDGGRVHVAALWVVDRIVAPA